MNSPLWRKTSKIFSPNGSLLSELRNPSLGMCKSASGATTARRFFKAPSSAAGRFLHSTRKLALAVCACVADCRSLLVWKVYTLAWGQISSKFSEFQPNKDRQRCYLSAQYWNSTVRSLYLKAILMAIKVFFSLFSPRNEQCYEHNLLREDQTFIFKGNIPRISSYTWLFAKNTGWFVVLRSNP